MSTIKDVAKLAGVSVATVSRVINDSGYVHQETLKKVEGAIKLLNYKPNTVARSLFKKSSRVIGLVVPDIINPFFPEIARAVEDVAYKAGYTVVLCNSDENSEKEKQYVDVLLRSNVDGFIVAASTQNSTSYLNLTVPIVAIDRKCGEDIPVVYSDNFEGSKKAAELLIEKGCKYLAHIRGPRNTSSANERYEGFLAAVANKNIWYTVVESKFNKQESEKTAIALLKEHPQIDGIAAGNDIIASAVVKAALQKGINIPNDLQVVGFDGIQLSEMMYPSITTVAQPIYTMGEKATKLLIKKVEGKQLTEKDYCLPVQLIERETTK